MIFESMIEVGNLLIVGADRVSRNEVAGSLPFLEGTNSVVIDCAATELQGDFTATLVNADFVVFLNIDHLQYGLHDFLARTIRTSRVEINIANRLDPHVMQIQTRWICGTASSLQACAPDIITLFSVSFDVESLQSEQILEQLQSSSPAQCVMDKNRTVAILKLGESYNEANIANAYKQEIKKWHPDKLQGIPEELIAIATRRTQEINSAYKFLLG